MENWLTAQQMADMNLISLPNTKAGVIYRAKKELWLNRKRLGKGGGLEYSVDGLPKDVQAEIKAKAIRSLMPKPNTSDHALMLKERDLSELTHEQRATADARLLMTLLVARFEAQTGGRAKAITLVSQLSRQRSLPVEAGMDYNAVCASAIAKTRDKPGVGIRKLHEWCLLADKCDSAEDRLKLLAPQKQGQPTIMPIQIVWLADFMSIYRNTNGLNVSEAYRIFELSYAAKHGAAAVPHIDAVHRALNKMPRYVREAGRITGSKMKTLLTYVKRDWNTSWFVNNDVWVGDGHSLKMKVQHPDHGRPFTPELTIIMDAPSRFVVGWSLAYSESTFAVADALRFGMEKHGIPAIYYSDNGSGQTNKALDTPLIGILPRVGVHHETGIPGNPQGRGIIERFNKTVPKWIAQQFETFYGAGADAETTRKTLVAVASLAKAQSEYKETLTSLQKKAKGQLPTWKQLLDAVEQAIDYYNNEWEHSVLGTTPAAYREALMQKMQADGVEIIPLSEVEARDMFRPSFTRKVQRGWLSVITHNYWHKALEPLDGTLVVAYVDIHDASSVIVRHQDGRYICDAVLDGNKHAAFPKPLVQQKREQRANTRIKKLEDEVSKAEMEKRPVLEEAQMATLNELNQQIAGSDVVPDDELAMFEWRVKTLKKVN